MGVDGARRLDRVLPGVMCAASKPGASAGRFAMVFGSMATAWTLAGCARLGYTDRVLHRAPSPDGQQVAVCQEVPEFDGPGFAVRLERPDGSLVRQLYEIGDADGCSELAWSPDGRVLAVLTEHVARIRFIDVKWAMRHAQTTTAHWSWRQLSFAGERQLVRGRALRFTGPREFELQLCPYSLEAVQRTGVLTCLEPPVVRRMAVPQPIVTGHPTTADTPH